MNLKEFKTAIKESGKADVFNELDFRFNLPHLKINVSLTGLINIFKFYKTESEAWQKESKLPKELQASADYFNNSLRTIVSFISANKGLQSNQIIGNWNNTRSQLERNNALFTRSCPESDFLLKIQQDFPNSFEGARAFITGQMNSNFFTTPDLLKGVLMAYEFQTKDHSEILNRRSAEKSSLSRLRNDFESTLSRSEITLTEKVDELEEIFNKKLEEIEKERVSKNEEIKKWFSSNDEKKETFFTDSEKHLDDLGNAYDELLKLKKPAEYWSKRAEELKGEGWKSLKWGIFIFIVILALLYTLLWISPDEIMNSFLAKDKSPAIRWSIVFITFISIAVFAIRVLLRVTYSSFHLARDAEERERLTYVYLALIKDSDSGVNDDERKLIMQSLFSRADTGLLKEDSSPSMPNDFVGKIFGK